MTYVAVGSLKEAIAFRVEWGIDMMLATELVLQYESYPRRRKAPSEVS